MGNLLATRGIEINWFTIIVGVIGVLFMYIFNYTDLDLEPLFYTSLPNWKYCHWICYFYIIYIFLWFLKYTSTKFNPNNVIHKCIIYMGKNSYVIYLFQIFYYATISLYVKDLLSNIDNSMCRHLLFIFFSTTICICFPFCQSLLSTKNVKKL